jgi:hypothetical protein
MTYAGIGILVLNGLNGCYYLITRCPYKLFARNEKYRCDKNERRHGYSWQHIQFLLGL